MTGELHNQLPHVIDRVKAGAAWLDEHYPDWHTHVNAFRLDMRDGSQCVLGQLAKADTVADKLSEWAEANDRFAANGYILLTDMHDMGWDMPANLGFVYPDILTEACGKHGDEDITTYVSALEAQWFLEIIGRQSARLRETNPNRRSVYAGSASA